MDLLSGQEAQKQKVPPVAWQIRRTQNFDIVALFSCSTVFSFGKTPWGKDAAEAFWTFEQE